MFKIYKELMPLNIKKQTTHSKNGQKTEIDISPEEIYRLPINT